MISRRGLIAGFMSLVVAAPAIVRAASLMPIKAIIPVKVMPPADELIGIIEDEEIGGILHPGKWKLFGVPTGRNFINFDHYYQPLKEDEDWKTYQGNWNLAKEKGLEGTLYRVERDEGGGE